jgi:hypothetical protein
MKLPIALLAALAAVALDLHAQNTQGKLGTAAVAADPTSSPTLTVFNLDFAGGSPQDLANAIRKASGKPLNAIIRDEYSEVHIPPLRMNNVTLPRLFAALEQASIRRVSYVASTAYVPSSSGGMAPVKSYNTGSFSYTFSTIGPVSDDSVWYFRVDEPSVPPQSPGRICRFYRLTPYLDRGLTVDDITTAVQTGWKMLGEQETPSISFHKDTQLLIAVGEPDKLQTIDMVLSALNSSDPAAGPATRPLKPAPAKPAATPKGNE